MDTIQKITGFVTRLYNDPAGKAKAIVILFPLFIVSLFFSLIATVRAFFYRIGIFRSEKLPAFVICVGNITVGGQGKTPVVIHLAQKLRDAGVGTAVVSRGYGFTVEGEYMVVSGPDGLRVSPGEGPDEAIMTARRLSGVPVIISPRRASAISAAVELFGAEAVIMDDGFQHLKVQRDMNILVMDGKNPFGNGLLIPAGPLREPWRAMERADILWLHGGDTEGTGGSEPFAGDEKRRGSGDIMNTPRIRSEYVPLRIVNQTGEVFPPSFLSKKRVLAFSGIARPERFFETIEELGGIVVHSLPFRDHYQFRESDFIAINHFAQRFGAEFVVTTEKDFSRIAGVPSLSLPLFALIMGISADGDDAMIRTIVSSITEGGRE
jgi:tetraacyldisaccharide 4'-kinase